MKTVTPPPALGFGPMSRNTVDAIIRLAYSRRLRIMIIASRSQIESPELGGGYVEGWSASALAQYVRARDPDVLLTLCRDHGGPWQHPSDSYEDDDATVMRRALSSIRSDIDAGFGVIHIDTSRERGRQVPFAVALERLVALYEEAQQYADETGHTISFEIGVEQQGREANEPVLFNSQIAEMLGALSAKRLPPPLFVVAQTGTHVRGMANDGQVIDESAPVLQKVRQLSDICSHRGTHLKAHNGDYLDSHLVQQLFAVGVHALNVAPELGVTETRLLLELLQRFNMPTERERFIELVHNSGSWAKWVDGSASALERALVAGHYVFATPEFKQIKHRLGAACDHRGLDLDELLQAQLTQALMKYACAYPDYYEVKSG